jgi:hypothetical protein
MFNFLRKYTDEENLLRESVPFDVSDSFLKSALSVERDNLGKFDEATLVVAEFNLDTQEYPSFSFSISREQHDELVERFRTVQGI